jgi:DNA-binding CsgD family transcriptional regulator
MEQPASVLRVAHQLGLALAVMNDPLEMAELVASYIQDLLGTVAVAIFTWDESAQRPVAIYSTPPDRAFAGGTSGDGPVEQAFRQRRPILVDDQLSPCGTPARDRAPGLQVVAAVPLIVAGAAVGVLSAVRMDKKPFTPADVDMLATLGALGMAPMIELDRLRRRVRELELRITLQQTQAETGELRRRLEASHAFRQSEASAGVAIPPLSRRESEVLPLLAQGYTNREIGATLRLSPGTVRNVVAGLLMKLHARDRTQAVVIALQHGLVDA